MHKYLEKKGEVNFDKIFNQRLGKYQLVLFFFPYQFVVVSYTL